MRELFLYRKENWHEFTTSILKSMRATDVESMSRCRWCHRQNWYIVILILILIRIRAVYTYRVFVVAVASLSWCYAVGVFLILLKRAFDSDDSQKHFYFISCSLFHSSLSLSHFIRIYIFDISVNHISILVGSVLVLDSELQTLILWSVSCVPQSFSHWIFRRFIRNLTQSCAFFEISFQSRKYFSRHNISVCENVIIFVV